MGIYRTSDPTQFDDVDGIIVDESAPAPSIQGVPANVVALVGQFERGPVEVLTSVGSIGEFHEIFGKSSTFSGNKELKNKRFGRLKVIRVAVTGAAKATLNLDDGAVTDLLQLDALYEGAYGNSLSVVVSAGTVSGKKLTITDLGANAVLGAEVYDNLDMTTQTAASISQLFKNSKLVKATFLSASAALADLSATPLAGGANGTVADTDYEAAIAIAEEERSCNALWSDKYNSVIKGYLKTHAASTRDKMVILSTDSVDDDADAALADVTTFRDTEGRIIYAWNALETTIDGIKEYTSPASWVASILSNTAPNIDPAFAGNVQYTQGASAIRHKISRAKYIELKEAGIAGFENDRDLGIKLKSGIVTQILSSSKVTILRRRMADWYSDSVALFLKNFQNAPNTQAQRNLVKGQILGWDNLQIAAGLLPGDDEVQDGKARVVDVDSLNTNDSIAAGYFKILAKRRIYSSMRFIVFQIEIGESVVVTESE